VQAQAAQSLSAEEVLSRVQSFYDQTTTVQARFRQSYYLKLYDRRESSTGRVVFSKPGKMRWDYDSPNGKVIVSDGDRLLVYEPPAEGESEGQGFESRVDQNELPSAFSFLTGAGRLGEQFRARLLDAETSGFTEGYALELWPRESSPHYDRLVFYVRMVSGEGETEAGVVQRVLIIDAAGNRNRFDFAELRFNRNVPSSTFAYRFPSGTRRIRP
jgi:outer membrane lipoprotein carrier protein